MGLAAQIDFSQVDEQIGAELMVSSHEGIDSGDELGVGEGLESGSGTGWVVGGATTNVDRGSEPASVKGAPGYADTDSSKRPAHIYTALDG